MRSFPLPAMLVPALLGAALLAGCASVKDRQGFLVDDQLAASVQPGVDNRDSVRGTLGRPSFTGQFDDRDWYYVGRETKTVSFGNPIPTAQTILHVRFDEAGNVESVRRGGLEQVASVDLYGKETPTLGRERGFFRELFGNIGTVGATGENSRTADNPN